MTKAMQGVRDDVRFAWRSVRSQRGLAAAAVLTLALGIAGSTIAYATLHVALRQQATIDEPERVARIWRIDPSLGVERGAVTSGQFLALRARIRSLDLAAFKTESRILTFASHSTRVNVQRVSGGFLNALARRPALGRLLVDTPAENGVVVSHELWQRLLAADPTALGRLLEIDGEQHPLVGVMPAGFGFPTAGTDVWMPLRLTPASGDVLVIARLADHATWRAARAELSGAFRELQLAEPGQRSAELRLVTVEEEAARKGRLGLVGVLGPALLLLTIACVNVGLLLLVRATSRAREIGVRAILGATPGRIARQLLVEGCLLALLSLPLAALLGYWGLLLVRGSLAGFAAHLAMRIGGGAGFLVAATLFAAATPLLFALAPAIHATRGDLMAALGRGAQRPTLRFGKYSGRDLLVALEMALTTVLLVTSGLTVRLLWELEHRVPVVAPQRLIVATASDTALARSAVSASERLDAVRALPGVEHAAAADGLPALGPRATAGLLPDDAAADQPAMPVRALRVTVDGLRTLGLPVWRGRDFLRGDREALAVVSARVATRFWPDTDPLARHVRLAGHQRTSERRFQIIGVLADTGAEMPQAFAVPAVYLLDDGSSHDLHYLLMRTAVPASAMLEEVRSALPSPASGQAWEIETFPQLMRRGFRDVRFMVFFVAVYGALAVALAAVGMHGVLREAVRQRFHEVGVRIAVGATRHDIASLVLRHGLAFIGVGVAVGGVLTLSTTRLLWSDIVSLSSGDGWTFLAVVTPLVAAAAWAFYRPVQEACSLDPLAVLRHE